MNYVKIEKDNLTFIDKDSINYDDMVEQLVLDELKIFYIYDSDKIIGILDRDDVLERTSPSFDKPYIRFFEKMPSSKVVQEILSTGLHKKLVVFVQDELVCEYRNLEYGFFPRQTYRNFMALRYVNLFREEFDEYFSKRNKKDIIVLSEVDIASYLNKEIKSANFIWYKNLDGVNIKSDTSILNFKYGKDYSECFKTQVWNQLEDFYYITEDVVFKKFIEYCKEKNIRYYFVKGPIESKLTCLSELERQNMNAGVTLNELLENNDAMRLIAQDRDDAEYLERRLLNATTALNNGFSIVESDISVEHLHIRNSIRTTIPDVIDYDREMHMYGPCITSGYMVSDEHTIESYLQKIYLENGIRYKVFNHGTNNGQFLLCDVINAMNTASRVGDVFAFIFEKDPVLELLNIEIYDSNEYFNLNKDINRTFFYDCAAHCNKYANQLMAQYLYEIVGNENATAKGNSETYFEEKKLELYKFDYYNITNPNLCSFFQRYSELQHEMTKYNKIGGMLMHAAPYTNGHQYLVETALQEMDAVIVFVMADYFHSLSVLDRVEIVKKNLADYENVYVIPIEPFAISSSYFPAYMFRQNSMFAESDLLKYSGEIVDKYIFSYFGIKYRYLGEEEPGSFTDNYNKLVQQEAAKQGITVKIIERKKANNREVISAGTARKAIKEKNYELLKGIVSNHTIHYLIENEIEMQ